MLHLPTWMIFFIGVIIPTYNMLAWCGRNFGGLIKRLLVKSEKQAIAWYHYEKHALKEGHSAKHPADCNDDECPKITRY